MKTILTFTLIMLFSVLAKAQDTTTVTAPIIVVKAYQGTTIPVKNMGVQLLKVIEDSRCPKGVDCVWAGNAKVLVQIIDSAGKKTQKEIVFSGGTIAPLYTEDGIEIILRGLAPYPNASSKINPKDYYLLMDVRVN